MGHEVLSVGMSHHLDVALTQPMIHIDALIQILPNGFEPDRIVWHDNSAPIGILGLENCDIPRVFYSVDTHHHHVAHTYAAGMFDHVLVAQKDFLPNFNVHDTPATWFPLWASEYMDYSPEKRHGAVFVGTLNPELNPARVAFFDRLRELAPIEVMQGHFPSIFPYAEIVVNQTVKGDLNFRVFEAMMSGALLLTEHRGHGLLELFQDGTHLVTYTADNAEEAADKIRSLFADPLRMRSIAMQGRDEILRAHRSIHRAQELESILRNIQKRPRYPRRHYGALMNLYSITSLTEDEFPYISHISLALALQCARDALSEGAIPNNLEAAYVIKTCLHHDVALSERAGEDLISAYAEAFPNLLAFSLLKMRALLNRGLREDAIKCARAINRDAPVDALFDYAEDTARVFMEQS